VLTSASRSGQIRLISLLLMPLSAQRVDQVVDLASADPVQVGHHYRREQRLIDPAAPLQQRGEERPCAQLRDPQLQIPLAAPRRRTAMIKRVTVVHARPSMDRAEVLRYWNEIHAS